MPHGPFHSEQVRDPHFEDLVTHICRRPVLSIGAASFEAVCAFLSGFDAARSGGPLMGLQPWLVLRADDGNNWSALARPLLPAVADDGGLSREEREVLALGRLLGEFFAYRRAQGLAKLFNDYARWLLRQGWYTGPLEQAEGRTPDLARQRAPHRRGARSATIAASTVRGRRAWASGGSPSRRWPPGSRSWAWPAMDCSSRHSWPCSATAG